jgi:hypothetical protein
MHPGRPAHKRKFAVEWLKGVFQDGYAHAVQDLVRDAIAAGISSETLMRALELLQAQSFKYGARWYWRLNSESFPNIF